jgi:hypothetical protein
VEEHVVSEVLNRDLSHLIVGDWILWSFVPKIRKMCTIQMTEKEPQIEEKIVSRNGSSYTINLPDV